MNLKNARCNNKQTKAQFKNKVLHYVFVILFSRYVFLCSSEYVQCVIHILYFNRLVYDTVQSRGRQLSEEIFLFVLGAAAPSGPGPLIHEVSRSHKSTHHSR
jgi:hypothetical protein